jgi:hypothetical protein
MDSTKNAQAGAQVKQSSHDKTRLAYWRKRIFKPVYEGKDGRKITSPNYCAEIQHKGKRVRWSLGPALPEAAAIRARDLYLFLVASGWSATLAKYRPATLPVADPSLGDFIARVRKTADLSPTTLHDYIASLQRIVSDIASLSDCPAKFGQGKGHKRWLERIYAVKLSVLTPTAIQEWKRGFLRAAGPDPLSQRSARVSVNSYLRCARSLFSPQILKHIDLELPSPLPFSEVEFEARQNVKYRSEFDLSEVITAAVKELAEADPEAFKIFCLAVFAGLRRREIDLLPWSAFRWEEGTLRIEATKHFSAKNEDSYADVPLDEEVLALFRGYGARATGAEFVIESSEPPRAGLTYRYYRSKKHFSRLIDWLRRHGVKSNKPLHCLRKEYGSQLCHAHGIYAASRGLRHSDIKITCAHYTDTRARATTGLGHLLDRQAKVIPLVA